MTTRIAFPDSRKQQMDLHDALFYVYRQQAALEAAAATDANARSILHDYAAMDFLTPASIDAFTKRVQKFQAGQS